MKGGFIIHKGEFKKIGGRVGSFKRVVGGFLNDDDVPLTEFEGLGLKKHKIKTIKTIKPLKYKF